MRKRIETNILSRLLFGKPLPTDAAPHQTISKKVGLAVFASDALSSVSYATQEILIVLVAAGVASFSVSLPIACAIIGILVILTISYKQTIYAYPNGGGAYTVAKENLGSLPAQIAGAALLMDYILTVAVSITAGVEQIASALPQYGEHNVIMSLVVLTFITIINLRGVKESGRIFAVPTFFFMSMIFLTLGVGFYRYFTGTLSSIDGVEMIHTTAEPLGLLLILRAFSSGCTALTGVEAISNGVTAFREPKSKNAATTMAVMSLILGIMFMGITMLALKANAVPSESETIISQLGRSIFGRGPLYALLMASTMTILFMAANTSFADFPRLSALQAGDGFLPRQLTFRSGRLVYGWGIVLLSVGAGILIEIFQARTHALIPLYAIGVFLSFTLSQAGMVVHWWRLRNQKGKDRVPMLTFKLLINGLGAVVTFVVMLVFAVTKFTHGAWVTVLLIPALVFFFYRIHGHYLRVYDALGFDRTPPEPATHSMRTIILLDEVHAGTKRMIEFAQSLGHPWTAVHVDYDDRKSEVVRQKWIRWIGNDKDLKIVSSPYRRLIGPVRDFILAERDRDPNTIIHVVTGQVVIEDPMSAFLHSKNARGLFDELQRHSRIVVTGVPIQL